MVKQRIVEALLVVAETDDDPRKAAACFELCICYLGDFGIPNLDPSNEEKALHWLGKAAKGGNKWARSIFLRLTKALRRDIPNDYPIRDWLFKCSSEGSRIAQETLKDFDSDAYLDALAQHCSKSFEDGNGDIPGMINMRFDQIINDNGDTKLHYAAAVGDCAEFDAYGMIQRIINNTNERGDTPLICASRAGHLEMTQKLINMGANGSICNNLGENGLHFLGSFQVKDVLEAGRLLCTAGADIYASATGFSGNIEYECRPLCGGLPALRAIALGHSNALETLLELESTLRERPSGSRIRSMFSSAVLLYDIRALFILKRHYEGTQAYRELVTAQWWRNGRLRNLAEICILGPVSANPGCGFDFPDKFWRYVNYGVEHFTCLDHSLRLIKALGFDFYNQELGAERNSLFFAIAEGKQEVVQWLLLSSMEGQSRDALRVFGKHLATQSQGQAPPLLTIDVANIKRKNLVDTDIYDDTTRDRGWLHNTTNSVLDQLMDPVPRARTQRVSNDNSSHISFSTDDSNSISESNDRSSDDDSRVLFNHDEGNSSAGVRIINGRDEMRQSRRNKHQNSKVESDVTNYTKKKGLVDAVIHSIRCGHRAILLDLLHYRKGYSLSRGKSKKVVVSIPNEEQDNLPTRGLSENFPGVSSVSHVGQLPAEREDFKHIEGDSALNYSLLFMSIIARSVHRDLYLA